MKYAGTKAPIRIGRGGLLTDVNPSDVPDSHLIEAQNVIIRDGKIQKEPGSRRWNKSALSDAIVASRGFSPTSAKSYIIAVTRSGEIHRFENRETSVQLTAALSTDPSTLQVTANSVFIVEGGQESIGNPKKLFIFSNSQVQVITGDEITYTSISGPSADFTTDSFPSFGVVHGDRLWVFLDHRAYASSPTDQEEFVTGGVQFPIFPGEGFALQSAYVFRKALFLFKNGGGMYQLIDSDVTATNWYFQRISGEFGVPAHEAMIESRDLIAFNDDGSLTSLSAVFKFGDVDSGDALELQKVKTFLLSLASNTDYQNRRAIFDHVRKVGYFALRGAESSTNSLIWKLDLSQDAPQITVIDKDQPNCFLISSLPTGSRKAFYGADDGYLYELDCEDREVGKVFNPVAPISTLGSGAGSLDNADYRFTTTFSDGTSETFQSAPTESVTVSDAATNGKIELTFVDVDSTGSATKRVIYGSKDSGAYLKVGEIADNTTTIYTISTDPATWTSVTLPTLNTFNTTYEMRYRTGALTFKHLDPQLEGMTKLFDYIEFAYEPASRDNVTLEYWIDGIYKRSRTFKVSKGPILDDFELDVDRLDNGTPRWIRFKLHGAGRSLSHRITNSGQLQNPIITHTNVYFRLSNEDQKAVKSGSKA